MTLQRCCRSSVLGHAPFQVYGVWFTCDGMKWQAGGRGPPTDLVLTTERDLTTDRVLNPQIVSDPLGGRRRAGEAGAELLKLLKTKEVQNGTPKTAPETLDPNPESLNPKPCMLNPRPQALQQLLKTKGVETWNPKTTPEILSS